MSGRGCFSPGFLDLKKVYKAKNTSRAKPGEVYSDALLPAFLSLGVGVFGAETKRTETLRRVCVGSASRLRRFRSREACPIRFKWATRVFSWNIYARDYLGCFHGEEIGDTQSGGRP